MSAITSSSPGLTSIANASNTPIEQTPALDFIATQARRVSALLSSNPLIAAGLSTLTGTGLGALAAGLLTAVSPMGGALYGLTAAITGTTTTFAIDWISEKMGGSPNNTILKATLTALPLITGIGAGFASLILAGFTLTPGTVMTLAFAPVGLLMAGVAICATGALGLTIAATGYDMYAGPMRSSGTTTAQA